MWASIIMDTTLSHLLSPHPSPFFFPNPTTYINIFIYYFSNIISALNPDTLQQITEFANKPKPNNFFAIQASKPNYKLFPSIIIAIFRSKRVAYSFNGLFFSSIFTPY
jgi:hypothetical protein